jgi:hypothetical protein
MNEGGGFDFVSAGFFTDNDKASVNASTTGTIGFVKIVYTLKDLPRLSEGGGGRICI